jgi:hypothetical protein
MSGTISDLITAAIAGAEQEDGAEVSYEQEKVAHQEIDFDLEDAEKVASALELIANVGVESLVKEAMGQKNYPALSSNEAAINYDPSVRNSIINPVLGQYFSNAKGENIHTKKTHKGSVKVASDLEEKKFLVKQALAAKLMEASHE